ncbi:hypothetical protein ABFS82_04G098700 [Erythranthe guttata]
MLPVSSASTSCSCHSQAVPIHGGLKSLSSYWKSFDSNCNIVGKSSKKFLNFTKKRPVKCLYSSSNFGASDVIFVEGGPTKTGVDDLISNGLPADTPLAIDPLDIDLNSISGEEKNLFDISDEINSSIVDTINGGEDVLKKSFDTITSSLKAALSKNAAEVDKIVNEITSLVDKSRESAGSKLTGFSGELKEGSGKVGFVALDVLRRAIVLFENFLIMGTKNIGNAYESVKVILPREFQDSLASSEGHFGDVLRPVGTAFQQVYIVLVGFEESLGLDPNDPLIPFVLFVGVSATLWGSYRVLKYSGYSGDLSPQSTMELLRGNESVVLIDIRPENLRGKDGIPDLRRSARSRYASVTLPEVDGSVKKLLKGGRDIEDSLLATVIRDLKIVEDRSKVLVMDADGTRSKGVARSLRKLGTKRPYQVEGGFRSWLKEGMRVKELKPETTLTILNEEAEAILEEIKPTPLKVVGFGVGVLAAAYSLLDWERTLQFIGVIGLGQTIFRRVASYQGADDFNQDVRVLLAPVKLGGEAISWAAGKLETNRNGLPTAPSSVDVQSRVLQAAAKHESQPSDASDQTQQDEVNISEA